MGVDTIAVQLKNPPWRAMAASCIHAWLRSLHDRSAPHPSRYGWSKTHSPQSSPRLLRLVIFALQIVRRKSTPKSGITLGAQGGHADAGRWYFGESAGVGGGLLSPVHHSVNDELAALLLLYPDRLLAELAVTVVFPGANRVALSGEAGHIIGVGLSGARFEGRITHNGQPVPFQSMHLFLGEVADFVEAIQQRCPPCATLDDGIRSVMITEAAREGPLQIALAERGVW